MAEHEREFDKFKVIRDSKTGEKIVQKKLDLKDPEEEEKLETKKDSFDAKKLEDEIAERKEMRWDQN